MSRFVQTPRHDFVRNICFYWCPSALVRWHCVFHYGIVLCCMYQYILLRFHLTNVLSRFGSSALEVRVSPKWTFEAEKLPASKFRLRLAMRKLLFLQRALSMRVLLNYSCRAVQQNVSTVVQTLSIFVVKSCSSILYCLLIDTCLVFFLLWCTRSLPVIRNRFRLWCDHRAVVADFQIDGVAVAEKIKRENIMSNPRFWHGAKGEKSHVTSD